MALEETDAKPKHDHHYYSYSTVGPAREEQLVESADLNSCHEHLVYNGNLE